MEEEAFMKRLLCTPRNFSTSFKKAFGVLPNEYRGGTAQLPPQQHPDHRLSLQGQRPVPKYRGTQLGKSSPAVCPGSHAVTAVTG